MTTPGAETARPARPAGRRRRIVLVLVAMALGLAAPSLWSVGTAALAGDGDGTSRLDEGTPFVGAWIMRPTKDGCRYDRRLGGMVAHFDVSAKAAGRFTIDLEAVTDGGAENLDVTTGHVVRTTVPFSGPGRRQLHVVVPLTQAEHRQGYGKCRYIVNPTGAH